MPINIIKAIMALLGSHTKSITRTLNTVESVGKTFTNKKNSKVKYMNQLPQGQSNTGSVKWLNTGATAIRWLSAGASVQKMINPATAAQNQSNRAPGAPGAPPEAPQANDNIFLSGVKEALGNVFTWDNMKALTGSTIGVAMEQQQIKDSLIARTGSPTLGTDIYDKISQQALGLGQDINQMLTGTMPFMSNTADPNQLMELNKLAMRLSVLNPEEGLGGAQEAVKELLSGGDVESVAKRFNMDPGMIEGSNIETAGAAGDTTSFISGMDELLKQQNITEEALGRMMDTPALKWTGIINRFNNELSQAGQGAVIALHPLLDLLTQAFEQGTMQGFFDGLSSLLIGVVNAITAIAQGLLWLIDLIQQNWGIAEPILVMIGSSLIPSLIIALWGMVSPILAAAGAWLLATWPLLLIGAAIGLLIYAMIYFGDTVTQVFGYIGGGIGALLAHLSNLYNRLLTFGDSVRIFFVDVANEAIDFINKVISALNKIPGIEIELHEKLKQVNAKKRESINVDDAWAKGQDMGEKVGSFAVEGTQKAFDSLSNMFKVPENPSMLKDSEMAKDPANLNNSPMMKGYTENIPSIDSVGEIGKINDSVDVSSEDLKTMRELAEMKNIQNFVSLTPTVSVTTGDINNGHSVDTIVTKIRTMLETEIASSAAGAYA